MMNIGGISVILSFISIFDYDYLESVQLQLNMSNYIEQRLGIFVIHLLSTLFTGTDMKPISKCFNNALMMGLHELMGRG